MASNGYNPYPLPGYRNASLCIYLISACVLIGVAIWQSSPDFHADSACDQNYTGNSDMYGIGIRLATYIQVAIFSLSVPLAYTPDMGASLAIVNNWFLVAYIMAFLVMVRDPATEPLVLYVITLQGDGLTVTMIKPPLIATGKRGARVHSIETIGGLIFRSIIVVTWRACTTYFWWVIVARLTPANTESCTQWGYLVVRVALENGSPLHVVHKVFNILNYMGIIVYLIIPQTFAHYMLGRLFLSLGSTTKGSAFFKPIHSHPNRPTNFRLFLDTVFVFTFGDISTILFGGISLPMTHWHVENSTNCVARCIDGPKKHEDDDISDAELVDRRMANFIIKKYNLTPIPTCPSSRRLTFQWFHRPFLPKEANHDKIWRKWVKYRDPDMWLGSQLFIFACFHILPVEFTIRANNVQGVNDVFQPGQILALVASLGGLLSVGIALCTRKSTSGIRSNVGERLYIPLDDDAEATECCRIQDIEQGVTSKKEKTGQEGSTKTDDGVVATTILEGDEK